MLSAQELSRYNRHIILPEFGKEGQEKLKSAKVLVVGAGGLGCPVLQYLTAAGIGTIGIIDFDTIEESNLQRQILFSSEDVGKLKAEVAADKCRKQNPYVAFNVYTSRLDAENALEIIKDYDVVVDGSDNFATRYLVSDATVLLDKPLVFGSIFKFEGQVSVFNYTFSDGKKGPTYRCLFPEPPNEGEVPDCSTIGVIGVLPGLIGCYQANEAIKVVTGLGMPLAGKLLLLNAFSMQTSTLSFRANAENYQINKIQEPPVVDCSLNDNDMQETYKEIKVDELKQKIDRGEELLILDVREHHEYEICNLGGLHIPMNTIPQHVEKIPEDKPVIVMCHHGMRSAWVVKFLTEEFGYKNLYNLDGGIHKWALLIDNDMPVY